MCKGHFPKKEHDDQCGWRALGLLRVRKGRQAGLPVHARQGAACQSECSGSQQRVFVGKPALLFTTSWLDQVLIVRVGTGHLE